jgi:hypothetical protein
LDGLAITICWPATCNKLGVRIASLLSIFSAASAPAAQSKPFDVVLQAAISDALDRHSGQGPAGYVAPSMALANAADDPMGSQEEETPATTQNAAALSDAVSSMATVSMAGVAPGTATGPANASNAEQQGFAAPAPMAAVRSETFAQAIAGSTQSITSSPSNIAAVPVFQGNRASGLAIHVSLHDAAIVGQPSQPPSIRLSQGAAAASKASAPWIQRAITPQKQSDPGLVPDAIASSVASRVVASKPAIESEAPISMSAAGNSLTTTSAVRDVTFSTPLAMETQRTVRPQPGTPPAHVDLAPQIEPTASLAQDSGIDNMPASTTPAIPAMLPPAELTSPVAKPAPAIEMPAITKAPSGRAWIQTTTTAQIGSARTMGTVAGGTPRIVWPATKFPGTMQRAMTSPSSHSATVPAPQSVPSLSAPEPPTAAVTPLPVAEAAAPVSVGVPELRSVAASSTYAPAGMDFAGNTRGDDFGTPQTASTPGEDAAPSDDPPASSAASAAAGRSAVDALRASDVPLASAVVAPASAAPVADTSQGTAPEMSVPKTPVAAPVAKTSVTPVRDGGHLASTVAVAAHDVPASAAGPATTRVAKTSSDPTPAPVVQTTDNAAPAALTASQVASAASTLVPAGLLDVAMKISVAAVDLPIAAALPGGPAQPAITQAQWDASRVTGPVGPGVNGTVEAAQVKNAVGSAIGDAPARSAQNLVPPAQHSHGDGSPAGVASPIAADTQVMQTMAVPAPAVGAHLAAHDTAATRAPETSRETLPRSDSPTLTQGVDDATPASGIHTASVIQAMGGTEMRVGMHSTEFGDISIRTSVSAQQMLTQIAVDHSGLGQAISAHASSMQTRFQEQYGVHSAIEVTNQGATFSGEQGSSMQREQQEFVRSARSDVAAAPEETEIGLGQLAIAGASSEYRLDIRA